MMPYEYVCHACNAVSPKRRDYREDAEDDRDVHRHGAHGGLKPAAGDDVHRVHAAARGDGVLPAGWQWAALFLLALVVANWWAH